MGTKRATFLSVAAGKEEERKIYFRQQFARNCRRLLPPTQKILHHSKNSKHSSLLCNKENFPATHLSYLEEDEEVQYGQRGEGDDVHEHQVHPGNVHGDVPEKKKRYFIDAHLRDMARTSYFTVVRTASSIVWFEICC